MIYAVLAVAIVIGGSDADAVERPTFARDIVPILQSTCQECHRPGKIAPMSLMTYEETRPWASAIRKEVVAKRMPPFHAAGPLGHWVDDPRLTDDEIRTFVRWVRQGAVRGDPADLPPPRTWTDSKWSLGEPDLVLEFPVHDISTAGTDEYIHLYTDHVFEENTWIRGVEFNSKYVDTLHHANVFVVPSDFKYRREKKSHEPLNILGLPALLTWLPGLIVQLLPEGQGIELSKDTSIGLVAHFAPRTEPRQETLRVGVYLANGTIDRVQGTIGSFMMEIVVPPYEPNYTFRETKEFLEDALVTHFGAHMHLRGKSAQYYFHYPDGTSELVLEVPKYDFDWQRNYYLTKPILAPKGTKFEMIAVWDNSADNPSNPDPSQTVRWGGRTVDEMFGGNAFYTSVNKRPEAVVVKDGIAVEKAVTESATQ